MASTGRLKSAAHAEQAGQPSCTSTAPPFDLSNPSKMNAPCFKDRTPPGLPSLHRRQTCMHTATWKPTL